jgi:N-acetylglutamate synthase-like GNAT family acetyltransferase
MTVEMRERARAAAAQAGFDNVAVLDGDLERLPVSCGSVDVVISNCVINLVPDKRRALVEAFRALRPGGRLAIVDTAFDAEPDPAVREDPDSWACCVGGALVADDYRRLVEQIGYEDVRLDFLEATCGDACGTSTRSVAVTARKPASSGDGPGVRPAVPADLDQIGRLLDAASLPRAGFKAEDAIVVLDEGSVRGAVALERYGAAALLRSLVVDPAWRSRGYGRRLVIGALEVARWSGADEVFLLTNDAQRYFERFGFVAVSRKRAGFACASEQFATAECESATAMRLSFETSDLPLLGRSARKELPTFQEGRCC